MIQHTLIHHRTEFVPGSCRRARAKSEIARVQEQQISGLERALHLSSICYSGGLSSYLDVLDAQRGLSPGDGRNYGHWCTLRDKV